MINTSEILQTVRMITEEKLDIRTITMGISLYECVHPDKKILYQNVYDRITTQARDLVKTGETLEREYERIPYEPLTQDVLGIPVRKVVIQVVAGRNIAVLVEAAVRNTILQLRGIDTYQEFVERHRKAMGPGH